MKVRGSSLTSLAGHVCTGDTPTNIVAESAYTDEMSEGEPVTVTARRVVGEVLRRVDEELVEGESKLVSLVQP